MYSSNTKNHPNDHLQGVRHAPRALPLLSPWAAVCVSLLLLACTEESASTSQQDQNAGAGEMSVEGGGEGGSVEGGMGGGEAGHGGGVSGGGSGGGSGGAADETGGEVGGSSNGGTEGGAQPEADDGRPLIEPEFVMDSVVLLPSSEGFDLSGDGLANNGLALLFEDPVVGPVLGGDPNEFIARSVRRGDLLLLMDFMNLNDFSNDPLSHLSLYLGRDTDGRRRNNFSGDQRFTVTCSSLTEMGVAESVFEQIRIDDHQLTGARGQFRFLVSFSNTEVLLREAKMTATIDQGGQTISGGQLGGAVTFADLEEVVVNDPEIGPQFATIMLNFLRRKLDVDLDGDGVSDALSASFSFTAVRAEIDLESDCAP